jgi:hypothetical protein
MIASWIQTQSWYSVHFGLGSTSTSEVPHILLIASTVLLEVLSFYLPSLFVALNDLTTLSPIQRLLPFLMGFSCFYAAISSVSLAGSVVLVTSLVLLSSKETVRRRIWRAQGVASFIFAVTSFAFQFPMFNFMATPGAFWYGLKRAGAGVPDPFTNQEVEADTGMLEKSIWGYALCTWAAGVYGMVCGRGEGGDEGVRGEEGGSTISKGVEMIESMIGVGKGIEKEEEEEEEEEENKRKFTVYQDADWGGEEEGGESEDFDDMIFFDANNDDGFHDDYRGPPIGRLQRTASIRNINRANASFNLAIRGVLRGRFLHLSVLFMFVSSLIHADGVGLIYLTTAVWCYRSSRAKCRKYWVVIMSTTLVLLFMQYFAILRLHPAMMTTVNDQWSDVFGGSWCGMFKQYR